MQLSIEKKAIGLVLGLLGAFALYAALAPAAQATEVTPTGTPIEITNSTPTDFIPTNANEAVGVRCQTSEAQFTVSNARNENRGPGTAGGPTGMFSQGDGSVITDMDANANGDRAPVFEDCDAFSFSLGSPVLDAEVETSEANGAWTIAAHASDTRDPMLSIGVPEDGAVIGIPDLPDADDCEITVSSDQASTVMAEWYNGSQQAEVDGQIDYVDNAGPACMGTTPAQFEAVYEPSPAVTVNP